ncbi:hypothetical protein [His2 virus]|uniref:Uncharacterized protein n=1 Tax=His 2 virus TaxID=128710 RepID=Q25BE4_HIS2V|nr:hypothetical protein His2V_gp16 [His2 virus]AAQ13784.1 hypothetical protein [His2 virus]
MTQVKTRYVKDGKGTAYTIMATYHLSEELEKVGFTSGVTLYSVFTSGTCVSHYDEYEVERNLPGNAKWVIDELHQLESEI